MKCIIIDDDELSRIVLRDHVKKITTLKLVKIFTNAPDAIEYLKKSSDIDLIFLDMEMPEMSGIGFLKSLKNLPQIIITSSKISYALEAFEYDVTDYIQKPVMYTRLYKSVNKAVETLRKIKQAPVINDGLFIKKSATSLQRLQFDDIIWIEALENYVGIHTYDNKYTILFTMKSLLSRLPAKMFERVHRSFIVNINKIEFLEEENLIIKTKAGKKDIPIAKSYRSKLNDKLNLIS